MILVVQHQRGTVTVGDVGGVNYDSEDEPLGVDEEMSLATTQVLRTVIAMGPPFSVVLTDWLSRMAALGSG
jgi:hypothetical protein